MKYLAPLFASLVLLSLPAHANPAGPAAAFDPALLPQYILADADMRDGVSLDGQWHYSVDPYRDGMADFLGKPSDVSKGRGSDVNVEDAEKANPNALFEYDLQGAPTGPVPSAWIG